FPPVIELVRVRFPLEKAKAPLSVSDCAPDTVPAVSVIAFPRLWPASLASSVPAVHVKTPLCRGFVVAPENCIFHALEVHLHALLLLPEKIALPVPLLIVVTPLYVLAPGMVVMPVFVIDKLPVVDAPLPMGPVIVVLPVPAIVRLRATASWLMFTLLRVSRFP